MIVFYITSHGYGHTIRACEVLRHLPADVPLTLRTAVPEPFLRRELDGRPATLSPASFDCGTLGPDSNLIDLSHTLSVLEPILDANDARLADEAAWLRSVGARLVVSDVPSFALRAARAAGVPSVLTANFTWAGIYRHLVQYEQPAPALGDRMRRAMDRLEADDAQGDLLLATDMAIPFEACRARRDVPMVARRGRNRRAELAAGLGLNPERPIYLLYLGREGLAGMYWSRLNAWPQPPQLVAFQVPEGAEGRVQVVPEALVRHADAAASVDAVVAKAGYGICGDCLAAGTPLLSPPRPQFAEFPASERLMTRWGGGLTCPMDDFTQLRWEPWLAELAARRSRLNPIDCNGGPVIAGILEAIRRGADPREFARSAED